MKRVKQQLLTFLTKYDVQLTVFGYAGCSLLYNIVGTKAMKWTDFYYTYTMAAGFGLVCIAYARDKDVFHRLILEAARWMFGINTLWFIMASFTQDKALKYSMEECVTVIIVISLAQLFALKKVLIKMAHEKN